RVQSLSKLNAFDRITTPRVVLEVDELLTLIEQKNAPEVDVAGIHFTVGYLGTSAKLMAQREKLLILFENLIYNAISFTPAGGTIQIMPRLVGEWVVIEVSDTGCGISAEHLPHVFEQFYTTRSQTGEGSGLGLYICKLTADELGGSIAVKSELAKGTSFTVCLPLSP
ncbi:MAG: ATP-binding protein, partial [Oscillospiraceae bacterium]